jgi:predicted TIM-barrel fold metal-dependent hydrolase
VGPERVLFGTDLPLLDPCASLYKVYDADIDEDARELILGGNMSRLTGV